MPSLFGLRVVKDKRLEGMTLLIVLDSYSLCLRATHCRFARDTTQTDSVYIGCQTRTSLLADGNQHLARNGALSNPALTENRRFLFSFWTK